MSEYEVYLLMDFPLINTWVCLERNSIFLFVVEAVCTIYKKANKQVQYKEN